MKTLLLSVLVALPMFAFSQIIVDKQDISQDSTVKFIVLTTSPVMKKVSVQVDYGQNKTISKPGALYDSNGQFKQFFSLAGILNYFYEQGWDLVSLEGDKAVMKRR